MVLQTLMIYGNIASKKHLMSNYYFQITYEREKSHYESNSDLFPVSGRLT